MELATMRRHDGKSIYAVRAGVSVESGSFLLLLWFFLLFNTG